MYLKFNKEHITGAQLKAIAAILDIPVEDLEWFYNVHYEVCKYEVECVIENNVDSSELVAIKQRDDYEEIINKFANNLYFAADWQLEQLYEKAECIVDIDDIVEDIYK